MNYIAPRAEPLIREIPLSRLALAPENVRKTPPGRNPPQRYRTDRSCGRTRDRTTVSPQIVNLEPRI